MLVAQCYSGGLRFYEWRSGEWGAFDRRKAGRVSVLLRLFRSVGGRSLILMGDCVCCRETAVNSYGGL